MNPSSKQVDRSVLVQSCILLMAMLWVAYWFRHALPYWEDDAYIHLEYARNVFEGKGFMFNGLISNGDTSPAWVLMLVGSHAVIGDWLEAGKGLTVACMLFAVSMAFIYVRRLCAAMHAKAGVAPALMVALFVFNPYFCYWVFSGMEAVFAAGWLMLIAMLLTPGKPGPGRFLGAALALGIAPLVRPEMILLVAVSGPFLLWQWWQWTRPMTAGRKALWFVVAAVLLALPLAAWAAYALHAFGYVLPNTNAAKRAAPGSSVLLRLIQVYGMGFPGVLIALGGLPAGVWLARHKGQVLKLRQVLPVMTWPLLIWALATTVFYVVNHTYVQTRYIAVVAPALMFTLFMAIQQVAARPVYMGVVGISLAWGLASSILLTHPFIRNKADGDQHVAEMAAFINRHLQPHQRIAVYSIGQLGYMTRNPLIDVGGITRPQASKFLWDPPEVMVRWAREQGADYYIMGDRPEPDATLVREIATPRIGWSLKPSFYEEVEHLRLWRLRKP